MVWAYTQKTKQQPLHDTFRELKVKGTRKETRQRRPAKTVKESMVMEIMEYMIKFRVTENMTLNRVWKQWKSQN